jgi:hypothetical protein
MRSAQQSLCLGQDAHRAVRTLREVHEAWETQIAQCPEAAMAAIDERMPLCHCKVIVAVAVALHQHCVQDLGLRHPDPKLAPR